MTDSFGNDDALSGILSEIIRAQSQAAKEIFGRLLPADGAGLSGADDAKRWATSMQRLQAMWLEFQNGQALDTAARPAHVTDPEYWLKMLETWRGRMPLSDPGSHMRLWVEGLALWEGVLGQHGIGPMANAAKDDASPAPRQDRRFSDAKWRDQPHFALIHQTYLMLAEHVTATIDGLEGLEPEKKAQLRFAGQALVDALSPSNFPLTNPQVIERALETRGDSLVKGMEHLLADLKRGQLTHTDPAAFRLGENIAVTPGKIVAETPLYQLIQYTPVTGKVLATPLVIFPPWINRYYILDLNPAKSFVRWAVEQGISVFMVSWKSADKSMSEVVWDDYIHAEIEAVDTICARLDVPSVHAIGYCVAGTTLAAALAVLARRGEAERVKSATFFTAQVDFEQAGDLKHFIDDQYIEAIGRLAPDGYLDGRYMAATFNLLRGNDLIWSYHIKNYLLGEDYPAFDLLHWNGDVTNLPAKWHESYLRDLYRDNRLAIPDSLAALGTPIDISRIETPCYIQAGREDHIAPPASVWKIMHYLRGPATFVLAGSGHIAGVVNPPAAGKYQYWTNDGPAESLDAFVAGAFEHKGSWWPHWAAWLRAQDGAEVAASGKRVPGGSGDPAIEDAPGRYVMLR